MLYWETEDFLYIEHLCIRPELRNQQYGRKALSLLQEKKKCIILEIDPPEDAISKDFLYIEHLCIRPELRNQQYGRKALSLLQEKKKCIILEIDPPEDAISKRRKGFYEGCGFVENPFSHIHPPYHAEYAGHPLVLMTYPQVLPVHIYDMFSQYLRERIMHGAFVGESSGKSAERNAD